MSECGGLVEFSPLERRHLHWDSFSGVFKIPVGNSSYSKNHLKEDETLEMTSKNEHDFLLWGV